ncbi:hypothetical protein [Streptomyces sp. AV19]|uniref:hypothetical protein n=1 Tax=Streptomyces sp. AV19 TaxID=2793068 RepID=UPI002412F91B|nr:hypothetical protein [Streptomyces sp. AV19]MDG4535336.1 hypothetical protein [Streptomyces sp. AV19]
MAEAYPTFLAGQRLTAALLASAQPMVVRKTADTSRASTATPTADPHLTFSVEANAVYVWHGFIKYFADPTPDLQVNFTAPTGSLGEWHQIAAGSGTTTGTTAGYSVRMDSNDVTSGRNFYGTSDTDMGAVIHGTLRVGSTAGTFALQWAQASSSATATILYTDSYIWMQRIA